MTFFDATPDAPFIQRAEIPGPDRATRRRLVFGRARGRRPGIRLRDGTGLMTTYQDPQQKADDALLADLREAMPEIRRRRGEQP